MPNFPLGYQSTGACIQKNNGVPAVHTLKKVTRPCSPKKSCYRGTGVQTDMSGIVDQGGGTVKSIVVFGKDATFAPTNTNLITFIDRKSSST